MRIFFMSMIIAASSSAAHAEETQITQLANEQAMLIISKDACQLTFDDDAVAQYIVTTVPQTELRTFFETVTSTVFNTGFAVENLSASDKAAYCEQTVQFAKSHNFIK